MQIIYKYHIEITSEENLDAAYLDKGSDTFGIGGNT